MLPPYHRQLVLPTVQAFLPPAQAQLVQRQQLQWQQLQQPAAEHATGQPAEPPAAEHATHAMPRPAAPPPPVLLGASFFFALLNHTLGCQIEGPCRAPACARAAAPPSPCLSRTGLVVGAWTQPCSLELQWDALLVVVVGKALQVVVVVGKALQVGLRASQVVVGKALQVGQRASQVVVVVVGTAQPLRLRSRR